MFLIVEPLLDDLLGGRDGHVDRLLAELQARAAHLAIQLALGLLQELPGFVARIRLELAGDGLAPLHCLLHLLPLQALDLGDLGVERSAQGFGVLQLLLRRGEIRLDLLPPRIEHGEQRTPGVLPQYPEEDEKRNDVGQQ